MHYIGDKYSSNKDDRVLDYDNGDIDLVTTNNFSNSSKSRIIDESNECHVISRMIDQSLVNKFEHKE